jgi:hypothetical protein
MFSEYWCRNLKKSGSLCVLFIGAVSCYYAGMCAEHWWNYTDRTKPKYSREQPVPVLLYSQQILNGLAWDRNTDLRHERLAINRLSHGTAS